MYSIWNNRLKTHGLIIVPIELPLYSHDFTSATAQADYSFENLFDQSVSRMDDLPHGDGPRVLGGFAAFGQSSNWHTPVNLMARLGVGKILTGIVSTDGVYKQMFVEIIPDRMLERPAGVTAAGESWHRDISPIVNTQGVQATEQDIIFGGWVNFNDTENQYFSCFIKSHMLTNELAANNRANNGFQKMSKQEQQQYELWKQQNQQGYAEITIPPKHAIIFNQSMVHEVRKTKLAFTMKRVFTAFRITNSPDPLISDIRGRLVRGESIPLKSGEIGSMYAKLHWTNHRALLENYAMRLPASKRTRKTVESGERKGDVHTVPIQPSPPTRIQNYSRIELALHTPLTVDRANRLYDILFSDIDSDEDN